MVQRLPDAYRLDPQDPRAPSEEHWARMSTEERARVVAALPIEVPEELQPPEGDFHRKAKVKTTDTLDDFFQRIGRKIYVSSELAVFYPDEPRFSPDVFAVLDVEHRDRTSWVVTEEGKGLDLVIEIHYAGDKAKDYKANVERYARLGIREYFIFDRLRLSLHGYRLSPPEEAQPGKRRTYRPILPQGGLFASHVLGLDLTVEGSKLRFFYGMAPVPEAEELVAKLQTMVDGLHARAEEAEQRAAIEAERAEAAATRADELERRLVKTREETLRLGIEGLCEILGIELHGERRVQLDALDAIGLDALQRTLRAERRWP
jgi:Uma2 family endonuclease